MNETPKFDLGEEVSFDIPDYGRGRGHVSAFYCHKDGTKLYTVLPKNPKITKKYPYLCIMVLESELTSTPF